MHKEIKGMLRIHKIRLKKQTHGANSAYLIYTVWWLKSLYNNTSYMFLKS